jgi:hypothetical protein
MQVVAYSSPLLLGKVVLFDYRIGAVTHSVSINQQVIVDVGVEVVVGLGISLGGGCGYGWQCGCGFVWVHACVDG